MGLINLIDGTKSDAVEDDGGRLQMPEEMPGTFRRQSIFLACLWAIWLSFIVSTMGQPPKKVCMHGRRVRASTCWLWPGFGASRFFFFLGF